MMQLAKHNTRSTDFTPYQLSSAGPEASATRSLQSLFDTDRMLARVDMLADEEWDSNDGVGPSRIAIDQAKRALVDIQPLPSPTTIAPDGHGGLGMHLRDGANRASIMISGLGAVELRLFVGGRLVRRQKLGDART